jgi:outer membrane immunogenic protein
VIPGSDLRKAISVFRCDHLRSERRDNDWLRLTSHDQREFKVFDGSVAMRRLLLAAMMFGAASGAQAADMPDFLRGSVGVPTTTNWRGFYVGAQGGYGSSDENFNGGGPSNMIAALIADDVIQQMGVAQWNLQLGKESQRSSGYGAFAGYNWQWDEVVTGLEMSYLHGAFGGSANATAGPLVGGPLSDTFYHAVSVDSASSIAITDMATFRARAGYAWGCFLPYIFGGFALGNANISSSVTVNDAVSKTPLGNFTQLMSLSADNVVHNHLIYGYTAGIGFDYNLIGGLFLRGEWEYIRFTSSVDTSVNTVRAGLGYKF